MHIQTIWSFAKRLWCRPALKNGVDLYINQGERLSLVRWSSILCLKDDRMACFNTTWLALMQKFSKSSWNVWKINQVESLKFHLGWVFELLFCIAHDKSDLPEHCKHLLEKLNSPTTRELPLTIGSSSVNKPLRAINFTSKFSEPSMSPAVHSILAQPLSLSIALLSWYIE